MENQTWIVGGVYQLLDQDGFIKESSSNRKVVNILGTAKFVAAAIVSGQVTKITDIYGAEICRDKAGVSHWFNEDELKYFAFTGNPANSTPEVPVATITINGLAPIHVANTNQLIIMVEQMLAITKHLERVLIPNEHVTVVYSNKTWLLKTTRDVNNFTDMIAAEIKYQKALAALDSVIVVTAEES